MARRFVRRWLPDPASLRTYRALRWMGLLLDRPWLWHINRSAIAKGLAIGMFFGILLPLGQALVAAAAAIGLRANLPAAVFATSSRTRLPLHSYFLRHTTLARPCLANQSRLCLPSRKTSVGSRRSVRWVSR